MDLLRSMLVVFAVTLLAASAAEAQDDQRARLHFESGASYYEAGEYEDALREFQRAYELSQRPQLFYNLSLCYQNLGDLPNAVAYLERYLNEVPDIENRANLEIRLRNLRERMEREASAATATTGTTSTTGTTGTTGETGTASTEPETTTTATTTETETETAVSSGPATETSPASGEPLNVGAIAGFSVAAAGLVVAGVFGGLTVAEDSRLAGTPCGAAATCTDADLGTLHGYAAATDVGFGVALAGAVVGLVFVIVGTGGSSEEHAGIQVTPLAGRDGAGLSVGGSF